MTPVHERQAADTTHGEQTYGENPRHRNPDFVGAEGLDARLEGGKSGARGLTLHARLPTKIFLASSGAEGELNSLDCAHTQMPRSQATAPARASARRRGASVGRWMHPLIAAGARPTDARWRWWIVVGRC